MKNDTVFRGMLQEEEVSNLLGDLISINSVNPLADNSSKGEKELALYIRGYLRNIGVRSSLQWVLEGRPNVIGILEGKNEGKNFVLESHMDTVRADNMRIDPFLPKIEAGKIFGRGACDDKGSLAAMLLALKLLKQKKKIPLNGNIYFAAVVDEEHKSAGVLHLLNQGIRFDAGIIGEPTSLQIIVALRGTIRFRIITKGVSAHSSEPEKGENAIYLMNTVIDSLRTKLVPFCKKRIHPLVGPPTLSVNTIRGGIQSNIIPDTCVIEIDRRMIPGENGPDVLREIDEVLNQLKIENGLLNVKREDPFAAVSPVEISKDEAVVQALSHSVRHNMSKEAKIGGERFSSDAGIFFGRKIPTPVFGPGNIAQAHSEVEWVEIKEVIQAAEIIAQAIVIYQDMKHS
jgi:acetylornithine deacetylase